MAVPRDEDILTLQTKKLNTRKGREEGKRSPNLQISVDDWWFLSVQVVESLCDLEEISDHVFLRKRFVLHRAIVYDLP